MPGIVKGNPKVMRCLLERMAVRAGFELVHDGKAGKQFGVEDPALYTRVYRLKLDGEFVNTYIRFKYDNRTRYADFSISWDDLAEWEELTEEDICEGLETPSPISK